MKKVGIVLVALCASTGTESKNNYDFTQANNYTQALPNGGGIATSSLTNFAAITSVGQGGFLYQPFGVQGTQTTSKFSVAGAVPTTGTTNVGYAAAIQADGKIVVAGYTNARGVNDFALARYNSNGTLDSSFGTQGTVTTSYFSINGAAPTQGTNNVAYAIALQPDGKILAAGYSMQGAKRFAVARYNIDGSIDTSFGTQGTVTTITFSSNGVQTVSADCNANGMALQSNGKIVVAGRAQVRAGNPTDFAIARYNTDGSLDTSFGNGGTMTTSIFSINGVVQTVGDDNTCKAIALQSDDKIVLVGYVLIQGERHHVLGLLVILLMEYWIQLLGHRELLPQLRLV